MTVNGKKHKTQSESQRIRTSKCITLYVLIFTLLGSTILLVGCFEESKSPKSGSSKSAGKISTIAAKQKKAELLKQLDSKFENPDAHYQLGKLYQADGLLSQAEYHYNTALSFQPIYREAQAALVKVLLDSGQKDKAGHYADTYMNQAADSAVESLKLGMAFQEQKLVDYALSCYEQALRLAPNSAKVNRQIGFCYLSKGDKEREKEYLSRSFDLNPNQPEVAVELGRLGVEVKIPRKAEKKTDLLDKDFKGVEKSGQKVK